MISQANAKTKPQGMEIRRFGMPYRACPWNMQKPTAGKGPQGNRGRILPRVKTVKFGCH